MKLEESTNTALGKNTTDGGISLDDRIVDCCSIMR